MRHNIIQPNTKETDPQANAFNQTQRYKKQKEDSSLTGKLQISANFAVMHPGK